MKLKHIQPCGANTRSWLGMGRESGDASASASRTGLNRKRTRDTEEDQRGKRRPSVVCGREGVHERRLITARQQKQCNVARNKHRQNDWRNIMKTYIAPMTYFPFFFFLLVTNITRHCIVAIIVTLVHTNYIRYE